MKIKIDHKTMFILDDKLEPNERLKEVNKTLQTVIDFDGDKMTVEGYLYYTWDKPLSRNIMDAIGTYLSKMPEQNGKEDKYVLSKNKKLEMNKGIKRIKKDGQNIYVKSPYRNFTYLSLEEKREIGILDCKETFE